MLRLGLQNEGGDTGEIIANNKKEYSASPNEEREIHHPHRINDARRPSIAIQKP